MKMYGINRREWMHLHGAGELFKKDMAPVDRLYNFEGTAADVEVVAEYFDEIGEHIAAEQLRATIR